MKNEERKGWAMFMCVGMSRQVAKGDRQKVRQRKMKGEKPSSFLFLGVDNLLLT